MAEYVVVRCTSCSQKYRVTLSAVGRQAKCVKCRTVFVISDDESVGEETVMAWITDDDPSSQSVMGSTGIFQTSEEPPVPVGPPPSPAPAAQRTREEPLAPGVSGGAGRDVKLRKIDADGAHVEVPAAALAGENLRNSFPRKCAGCGSKIDLDVHLIRWPERWTTADRVQRKDAVEPAVGKLESFADSPDRPLLKQLPRARYVTRPFNLPFPVFACESCDVSGEVEAHVVTRGRGEVCRLRIASLATAVAFFRNNGGRGSPAYRRLIEERDIRRDPWRELDPGIRNRIAVWFRPQPGERFVRFFRDTEFSLAEAGKAGIALTDRRLVFKLRATCEGYPLDQDGRLELMSKGDLAIVHVYQEGHPPAVAKLDPLSVEELTGSLQKLRCRWAILT